MDQIDPPTTPPRWLTTGQVRRKYPTLTRATLCAWADAVEGLARREYYKQSAAGFLNLFNDALLEQLLADRERKRRLTPTAPSAARETVDVGD